MTSSLVGSEMCIRDSPASVKKSYSAIVSVAPRATGTCVRMCRPGQSAVSYTHLTLPTICSV
eukprot:9044407-Prorocentrum_lima.AAC.1